MGRGLLLWLLGIPVADYSSDLVVRRAAWLILRVTRSVALKDAGSPPRVRQRQDAMSGTERREIAEALFEPSQARERIRDAIKLDEGRRSALVKNLYRLRTLRLSRDRGSMRTQEG
jgi:hypothetical protein